jgi:hypothetical protein
VSTSVCSIVANFCTLCLQQEEAARREALKRQILEQREQARLEKERTREAEREERDKKREEERKEREKAKEEARVSLSWSRICVQVLDADALST